jgi:acyl dehydratase
MTEIKDLAGHDLGSRVCTYSERDAILYALAVGASEDDLDLVYERRLHVLPTFGLTFGLWAVEAAGALGAYDPTRTLHASQRLTVRRPLSPADSLEVNGRIAGVWDKGSAALVDVEVECDAVSAVYTIYVTDGGGWGGDRGPASPSAPAEGEPTATPRVGTTSGQAALYRLTGDLHPLHIDRDVACANGFEGPILHGLCTLGIAARVAAEVAGVAPWDLIELSARFAAVVYPGATLEVPVWADGNGTAAFGARVDGKDVLKSGSARFG